MVCRGEHLTPEERIEFLAYEAYQSFVAFHCSEPLPKWKDLSDYERTSWTVVAMTVRGAVINWGF